jgi:hypothetical protein
MIQVLLYLPGETVIPSNVAMKMIFKASKATYQCLALAIDPKNNKILYIFLNERYPRVIINSGS